MDHCIKEKPQIPSPLDELDHLDQLDPADIDHTPSTVTTALPTPHEYLTGPEQTSWPPQIYAPAAPVIRDLDSFTDGTAAGSFDCLSEVTTPGDLCAHPLTTLHERNVSRLDEEDHMQSIALWREDVRLEAEEGIVHIGSDSRSEAVPVQLELEATPMCKRPRSVASSDDGRKRVRVALNSSPALPCSLSIPPRPHTRRARTVSAPPLFVSRIL